MNAKAQIYGSGQNKFSWISFLDVARFVVASVDNPAAFNTVIELGGPEALSPLEVVKIFEELGERPFTVNHVSEEALRAQKVAATDSLQEAFATLMLSCTRGHVVDMRPALRISLYDWTSSPACAITKSAP